MKPNDNNKSYQAKQQEQQTAEQSENGFSETSASPEAVHNSKAAPLPLTKSSTTATTTSSNPLVITIILAAKESQVNPN